MRFLIATLIAVLSMAGLARACTNPVGAAGDATFNTTSNVPAYCDGTNWIAMVGGTPPAPSTMTQVVPSGLIGHWRLDETSGTTAFDSSGNGYNGTMLTGVENPANSLVAPIGKGRRFPFNSSVINISHNGGLDNLNQVTISTWIFRNSNGGGSQGRIFEIPGNLRFILWNGGLGFRADRWSGNIGVWESSAALPRGQWAHYVVTYDYSSTTNNPIVYINGSPSYTLARAQAPTGSVAMAATTNVYLGNNAAAGLGIDNNTLDDVRIYNRVLTPAEVQELYQAQDGMRYNSNQRTMEYFDQNRWVSMTPPWQDVTSGLVGHWKLDETTGTTAADSSGNGLNGAMDGNWPTGTSGFSTFSSVGPVGRGLMITSLAGINVPHNPLLDMTTQTTMAAWVKFSPNTDVGWKRIIGKISGINDYHFAVNTSFNTICFTFLGGNNHCSSFTFLNNVWYHVATSFDQNAQRVVLYVDGAEIGNVTGVTDTIVSSATDVVLAQYGFNPDAKDDIRLYNRVLSATEIRALYNMGAPVGATTALPTGCSTIGQVCDDGTVYAGLSPDGSVAMYGHSVSLETQLPWNNGNSSGYVDVAGLANNVGAANTAILVTTDSDSVTSAFQPHQAAQYCANLNAHGADDWYLPSPSELGLLCAARAFGGVTWISLDTISTNADYLFADCSYGGAGAPNKQGTNRVQCVRKGPAPRCANPYGLEGSVLFNNTHNVLQFCDGARWIAIGKSGP